MATLLDTMAGRAEAQCNERLDAARKKAEEILDEARQRAQERYDRGLEKIQADLATQRERAKQLAEAEGDKIVQAAEHEIASDAMEQAHKRLQGMVGEADFGNMIEALLAEAVAASRGPIQVLAPPAHVDRCRNWLSTNGHGNAEVIASDEVPDGVAVQDPERTYRLTNTLTSRYTKLEPRARKLLMARLFGKGGGQ